MLNIEYYKDELKEIIIRNIGINAITGKPKMCDDLFRRLKRSIFFQREPVVISME